MTRTRQRLVTGEQMTVKRILGRRGGGMSYDRVAKQRNAAGVIDNPGANR